MELPRLNLISTETRSSFPRKTMDKQTPQNPNIEHARNAHEFQKKPTKRDARHQISDVYGKTAIPAPSQEYRGKKCPRGPNTLIMSSGTRGRHASGRISTTASQ